MTLALILAAGSGERLGAARPKALVELAGRPLLSWSIDALAAVRGIEEIVLALPEGAEPDSLGLRAPGAELHFVTGGAVRSQSVQAALAAGRGDPVLVHDAARPLLRPELAEAVIAALAVRPQAQAAIAAMPVTDTIKRVDSEHVVTETLDRAALWAVQTPQVFRREALERALAVEPSQLARATDDAWLIEQAGGQVVVVRSEAENLKVTVPADLALAELLLAGRRAVRANPA